MKTKFPLSQASVLILLLFLFERNKQANNSLSSKICRFTPLYFYRLFGCNTLKQLKRSPNRQFSASSGRKDQSPPSFAVEGCEVCFRRGGSGFGISDLRFQIGFDWVCISYLVLRIAYRAGGLGLNWVCFFGLRKRRFFCNPLL